MPEVTFMVRTADQTRKAQLTLDRGLLGGDVMQAAVNNWALPPDTDYSLVNVTTGKPVSAQDPLRVEAVSDGDMLEVQPVLVAGSAHS